MQLQGPPPPEGTTYMQERLSMLCAAPLAHLCSGSSLGSGARLFFDPMDNSYYTIVSKSDGSTRKGAGCAGGKTMSSDHCAPCVVKRQ